MTVTDVHKDPIALTMTVASEKPRSPACGCFGPTHANSSAGGVRPRTRQPWSNTTCVRVGGSATS